MINDKKICEEIGYKPNSWQQKVRDSDARFKVIVAGRRAGKTMFVAQDPKVGIVKYLFEKNKNVWVVAPSYDLTERIWELVLKLCRGKLAPLIEKIYSTRGQQRIITKGGTVIEAKSADSPEMLVGKGLDALFCDESAMIPEKAWHESLRPSLIDRKGVAIFIGTPKQKNWFYNLYIKGQDPEDKVHKSWQFSSYENGYIDSKELDAIVKDMPEMEYQQEILADFLEGFGQIFRGIRKNIRACERGPETGHRYIVGVDLAKARDFTVIVVIDRDRNEVVHIDRFKEMDYNLQKPRIEAISRRYNRALVVADGTGVGAPVCEDLRSVGLSLKPFVFSTKSKEELISKLMIAIEQGKIFYPANIELLSELESFGKWNPKRGITEYCAPPGIHDDCVIALGLANWYLKEPSNRTFETENPYVTKWQTAWGCK